MEKNIKNHKKPIIIVCAIVILAIILIIGTIITLKIMDSAYDKNSNKYVSVTIESGSGTEEIGNILVENNIIKSTINFKIISKIKGYDGKFKAGTYSLSSSMTTTDIAKLLISGKVENMAFTIPEGYTIFQIADKLSAEGLVNKETMYELLKTGDYNYDFLSGAQTGKNHLEGYLFPNTYKIEVNASEDTIIKTMLNQFKIIFTDKYKTRAQSLGYSINDIITIASIIERECSVDNERAKVASVIYNRLKKPMPLQMCSTVQYVLGKQKESLTTADTKIDSPYNTYLIQGLPPGPICCPGEASIKAALYPETTNYLYFVLSDKLDGTTKFSSNYNQFLNDKAAYYNALEN